MVCFVVNFNTNSEIYPGQVQRKPVLPNCPKYHSVELFIFYFYNDHVTDTLMYLTTDLNYMKSDFYLRH